MQEEAEEEKKKNRMEKGAEKKGENVEGNFHV